MSTRILASGRKVRCLECAGDGVYQDEDLLISVRCPRCDGRGTRLVKRVEPVQSPKAGAR